MPDILDGDILGWKEDRKELVCPWCGHRFSDSWEIEDGEHDNFQCEECEAYFEVVVDSEIIRTYASRRLEDRCQSIKDSMNTHYDTRTGEFDHTPVKKRCRATRQDGSNFCAYCLLGDAADGIQKVVELLNG